MDTRAEVLLSLLRSSGDTSWVAEQVTRSIAEGISTPVKDAAKDARFKEQEPPAIKAADQRKRQKYETTRAYTEPEEFNLVLSAFEALYVELPAVQVAGLKQLLELGSTAVAIEFIPPDASEPDVHAYTISIEQVQNRQLILEESFANFVKEAGL